MESPVPRRFSSTIAIPINGTGVPDIGNVINSYEAEEERIVNVLSRKLEQLRDEKIQLEHILEAESESHVNRLSRELFALRQAQQATQQTGSAVYDDDSISSSPVHSTHLMDPRFPSAEVMLNAVRKENEILRSRLVDAEREFIRISRLNDVYREELIDHRRKLGIATDNLINPSNVDPFSQPLHYRRESSTSSPIVPTNPLPINRRSSPGPLPIPRPPSQIHRPSGPPVPLPTTSAQTSASSPSSSLPASPFPFSPLSSSLTSAAQTGYSTNLTTPASVPPLSTIPPTAFTTPNQLTYPHAPPPSLSSSLGSPVVMFSPVNAPSRRNSRVAETGSLVRRGSSVDRPSRPVTGGYVSPNNGVADINEEAPLP